MTSESGERTIRVYPVRSDADIAVARLAADGIRSRVAQDDEGGLNPGFFGHYGVRVVVADVDLDEAYDSLGIERVRLDRRLLDAMVWHARSEYPDEACGLVAVDDDGTPSVFYALSNAAHSAHRFTIDPVEHFGANRNAESLGLSIGGVFHSHPASDAYPSRADVSGGADPGWLHVIIGPVGGSPGVRAFRIVDGHVDEMVLEVV